jgi:hypothetical protein
MASQSPSPEALREKLAAEVDLVPWSEMRSHALAGRLFLVAGSLDLLQVAAAIALDAATEVAGWVEDGSLIRPGGREVERLDDAPQREFQCVIVQPFVLARDPERSG